MEPARIIILMQDIHDHIFDPARLPVAAVAMVFVAFMGVVGMAVAGNANPFFWRLIDIVFGPLGVKLDKPDRSYNDLVTRGTIVTFLVVIFAFVVGVILQELSNDYPAYLLIDIVALSLVLTVGTVWQGLVRLNQALGRKDLVRGAFFTIAKTTRTNLAGSDEYTITRTGIGMGAKAFDKGVVAPILWYLIGGLPAAYIYAGLAALAWRFGKEGFTKGFGSPALALEKLMGTVPNLLAGLYIALAGLITPTAGMTRAVFSLVPLRKGASSYAEGGAAVTSMAYALDVSLGGASLDIDGSAIKRRWAGPEKASAQLGAGHLHRALYVIVIAHLLLLVSLLAATIFKG